MSIYFPEELRPILELKVKKAGQKAENLDDEHDTSDGYSTQNDDYTMGEDENNTGGEENDQNQNDDTGSDNSGQSDNTGDDTSTNSADTGNTEDPENVDGEDTGNGDETDNTLNQGGDEEDYSLDDTDVQADDTGDGTEGDGTDTGDGTEGDGTDTGEGGDDYSLDDTTGDEGTDDGDTGDPPLDDGSGQTKSELQNMEGDLFKDLTPEQLNIKVTELKQRYADVYESIDNIMTRLNRLSKTQENIKVIQFITNKLLELRQIVYYYLTNTFDTKTYIENSINYQEYLATISVINKIFKEINKEKK